MQEILDIRDAADPRRALDDRDDDPGFFGLPAQEHDPFSALTLREPLGMRSFAEELGMTFWESVASSNERSLSSLCATRRASPLSSAATVRPARLT